MDLLLGHPEAARDRLAPLIALESNELKVPALAILAWAYLACGQQEQARATVDEAVRRGQLPAYRLHLPEALRVQGMILAEQERWEDARRTFAEAVALAQPMPYPYAGARVLYEWGLMELREGHKTRAREMEEQVLAIFQRLGARPFVERTAQVLTALD